MPLKVVPLRVLGRDDPVVCGSLGARQPIEVLARRLDLDGARDLHLARVLLDRLPEALDQRVGLRRSSFDHAERPTPTVMSSAPRC